MKNTKSEQNIYNNTINSLLNLSKSIIEDMKKISNYSLWSNRNNLEYTLYLIQNRCKNEKPTTVKRAAIFSLSALEQLGYILWLVSSKIKADYNNSIDAYLNAQFNIHLLGITVGWKLNNPSDTSATDLKSLIFFGYKFIPLELLTYDGSLSHEKNIFHDYDLENYTSIPKDKNLTKVNEINLIKSVNTINRRLLYIPSIIKNWFEKIEKIESFSSEELRIIQGLVFWGNFVFKGEEIINFTDILFSYNSEEDKISFTEYDWPGAQDINRVILPAIRSSDVFYPGVISSHNRENRIKIMSEACWFAHKILNDNYTNKNQEFQDILDKIFESVLNESGFFETMKATIDNTQMNLMNIFSDFYQITNIQNSSDSNMTQDILSLLGIELKNVNISIIRPLRGERFSAVEHISSALQLSDQNTRSSIKNVVKPGFLDFKKNQVRRQAIVTVQ